MRLENGCEEMDVFIFRSNNSKTNSHAWVHSVVLDGEDSADNSSLYVCVLECTNSTAA